MEDNAAGKSAAIGFVIADQGEHPMAFAQGFDLCLGAQAIEGEAARQVFGARALAIEQQDLALGGDEEIMQELALGGEQDGVYGAGCRYFLHIVAHQGLEIAAGVRAGDGEHAPLLERDIMAAIHG